MEHVYGTFGRPRYIEQTMRQKYLFQAHLFITIGIKRVMALASRFPFVHPEELSAGKKLLASERFFHFSSESIAKRKIRANAESNAHKISSF